MQNLFKEIYDSKEYPREIIEQIANDRENYESILIDFINSLIDYPEMMRDDNFLNQLVVAVVILSYWKSENAFEVIVDFLKEFGGEFEVYLDSFDLEDLNPAVIRTYNGNLDKLKELIFCDRICEYVRCIGLKCLNIEYYKKNITKSWLLDFYKPLLLERDDVDFLKAVLLTINSINPYELQTEIDNALKFIFENERGWVLENEDFDFSDEKQSKFDAHLKQDFDFNKRHDDLHERIEFWYEGGFNQYDYHHESDNYEVNSQNKSKENKKKTKNKRKQAKASKKKNRKKK
ncbi:DUF1186 domain-containing protein [Francisella hispaniensis]|uniref:DUF1186 domain-containing protein n=1 Tax=Francisella hispaniensis TaxID=622488 RepID=UPI0019082CE1|nr:DUF1186 domain-containing protein [Francisella hispaniensis]MBK2357701.1 DUF1186 domain-containing protein [Francisella hispaniensis]